MIQYKEKQDFYMRLMVREILHDASVYGISSPHLYYIKFITKYRGCSVPSYLLDKHPYVMTIVLQNDFCDLDIQTSHFSVQLYFGKQPETIQVPFLALQSFIDPSVNFSIEFSPTAESLEVPADNMENDNILYFPK